MKKSIHDTIVERLLESGCHIIRESRTYTVVSNYPGLAANISFYVGRRGGLRRGVTRQSSMSLTGTAFYFLLVN